MREGTSMAEGQTTIEYRDIPGCPGYRVGSDGSVWSAWKRISLGGRSGTAVVIASEWKQLTPRREKVTGYLQVRLVGKTRRVHSLVLIAFVGPRPDGMECCHGDGNPANNHLSNLRWDTPKSNHSDRGRHGTGNHGVRNHFAKLTPDAVRHIRSVKANRRNPLRILAQHYGVSLGTIGDIRRRRSWAHIE